MKKLKLQGKEVKEEDDKKKRFGDTGTGAKLNKSGKSWKINFENIN